MLQNLPEGRYDGFVPVPLHPKRLRERGFNQSELLCRAMSEKSGIPVLNALARTRQTSSQAKLSGKERHTNILDAFSCVMDVSGQTLILVDDVVTTGSTASACAKALLSAGAKQVCLLCAARADLKRPQDS